MFKNDIAQLLYLISACRMWQRHFDAMSRPAPANHGRVVPFARRRARAAPAGAAS